MSEQSELDLELDDDFDLVELVATQNRAKDSRILQQLQAVQDGSAKAAKSSKGKKKKTIEEQIAEIKEHVTSQLGMHQKDIQVITEEADLESFINRAIVNGICAYDTETDNSLDYLTCKVIGLCLYTPGLQAAYVPLHHVDLQGNELPNQISDAFAAKMLRWLLNNEVKIITHNGKFDYQDTKCFLHVEVKSYWDTMIACRLIDENEPEAGLKFQYKDKVDKTHPYYDIDEMFPGIQYIYVPPELFALYAAIDALMTFRLFVWQKTVLDLPENKDVLKLFMNVEMPLVVPVAEMELRGVLFDFPYCRRLESKYTTILADMDAQIDAEIKNLSDKIQAWRNTPEANIRLTKGGDEAFYGKTKSEQLTDPINLGSPAQLAILIYDVLGVAPVSTDKPRSVDKKILKIIAARDKLPLCVLLVKRRTIEKLLNDFISKLPTLVRVDGAIHCQFNQSGKEEDGVVTGRFSSSEPNMQNIPSHNTEIRPVFKARPGYVFVGADFKAQEPRLTAYYSQDENMLEAYKTGKDLYAVIASAAFDNRYEDNLEFYPEGTEIEIEGQKIICGYKTHKNEEGYARRSQAKSILLGILYGRGAASIGEQIGKDYKQAKKIIDKFFESFPRVKQWIDATHDKAKNLNYVEDWYGRKRHLPMINFRKYTAEYTEGVKAGDRMFNPILGCPGRIVDGGKLNQYIMRCQNASKKEEVSQIIKEAAREKIKITDNTGIIAKAERQSVNSIVQGGAATLTKMAMRDLYYDEELRRLDYHMLITVHDEVLGECPRENLEAVEKRITTIMTTVSAPYLNVPMGVDIEVGDKWYINNYISSVIAEYKELVEGDSKKGIPPMHADEAYKIMAERHTEVLESELHDMLYNNQ